jgi:hypothetical protein
LSKRVVRKTPVAGEVFDDHHLVLCDDVPADGDIARGLPRLGEIFGQADLRFEKLPIPIDERDERDRHLEDAREFCGDAVEDRLGFRIEQIQFSERGEAFFLVRREWRGRHFLAHRRGELGDLHERVRQRGDHFVSARIA